MLGTKWLEMWWQNTPPKNIIYNQTLHVKIVNPAVRNDLLMRRTDLIKALNEAAGGNLVITDIRYIKL